jgi:hypothetical protein
MSLKTHFEQVPLEKIAHVIQTRNQSNDQIIEPPVKRKPVKESAKGRRAPKVRVK